MDHFLINETQFDKAMCRETLQVNSFIRGYHGYMDVWVPNNGDECNLKREPRNVKDQNAVAVIRTVQNGGSNGTSLSPASHHDHHPNEMTDDFQVIGHVSKLMPLLLTKFSEERNKYWQSNHSRQTCRQRRRLNKEGFELKNCSAET